MKFCWVIPHFNHASEFRRFLPKLANANLPCIVVDDGSEQSQLEQLNTAISEHVSITLLRHATNRGKGAAVLTGCHHARNLGFTHIIQIDADGQHAPSDVSRFIAASKANPSAIVSGYPVFDGTAPKARKYGRRITTFWVMLETLSLQIKDALCGYRVYPLDSVERLVDQFHIGVHMEFDTDILVKAVWINVPVVFIDTQVQYIAGARSHFHYLRDNIRLIRLHTRLLLQSLRYLPGSLIRRLL